MNSEYNFEINIFKEDFASSQVISFIPFIEINIIGYCPCSFIYTDFSISKLLNNFLFSSLFFISKKCFIVDILSVFPNLLGRVNNFIFEPSFKISSINFVLST